MSITLQSLRGDIITLKTQFLSFVNTYNTYHKVRYIVLTKTETDRDGGNIVIPLGSTVLSGATNIEAVIYENNVAIDTAGIVALTYSGTTITTVTLMFDAEVGDLKIILKTLI